MILAFESDNTVTAYEDVAQVNDCCRTCDVEGGHYMFTDQHGFVLAPHMPKSAQCSRWLSLFKWTAPKGYTLEKTSEQRLDLIDGLLSGQITVCLGPAALSDHEIFELLRPSAPVAK